MNEYDELLRGQPASNEYDGQLQKDDSQQRLRASLYGALKVNPDQAARARQLSTQTGIPAAVVQRNLPDVEQRAKLNEYDALLGSAPRLAGKLQDPNFAAVAHDDAPALTQIEQTIGPVVGPKPGLSSIAKGLGQSFVSGARSARAGLRMQFADLFGFDEMRQRAEREYAGAQLEQDIATPEFESSTARGIYSGGASTLRAIPGIAASIATRSAAPALASAGIQTETEAYAKYRERGASAGQALAGAAGEGAVEVATELLPMRFLVDKFGKAGAGQFLTGLLAREIPSEQAATLAQDAIDTAIANPDKTWEDYLKERPDAAYQTLLATLVQSGVMGGASAAAQRLKEREQRAQFADQNAQALTRLGEVAAESKLRQRDPEAFKEFVKAATENGPVTELYVDAATLTNALQQAGIDPATLSQVMPSVVEQLAEAQVTQGDIRIPLEDFATHFAGNDIGNALLPHVRPEVDALSQSEAQTFLQERANEFQADAEKVLAEREFDTAFKESAQTVESELLAQLTQANRFTKDVDSAYAKMMAAFYTTQAARLGITPEEMYVRYPVRITAEGTRGTATLDQFPGIDPSLLDSAALPTEATQIETPIAAKDGKQYTVRISEESFGRSGRINSVLAEVLDANGQQVGKVDFGIRTDGVLAAENAIIAKEFKGKGLAEAAYRAVRDAGYDIAPGRKQTEEGDPFVAALERKGVINRTRNDALSILEQRARGQISFGVDLSKGATISLFENADLSTFLHESGHFYLEVLSDLASQPDAPVEFGADLHAIEQWFGLQPWQWQEMTLEQKRPYHEQFARGFEAYLFEGKAPSVELQGLFSRFRAWLLNVYKQLTNLNVTLTDEVRGVFDRMLATNEQILDAQQARAYAPLFSTAEDSGLAPQEFADYQALGQEATQTAVDDLQRRSLRDMRWLTNARSKKLKQLQREAASKRKAVEAEVRAEVMAEPINQVRTFLTTGEMTSPDGEQIKVEKGYRLSLDALEEMYPESGLGNPAWRDLPKRMLGRDGLHPDQVAKIFGFTSGDELVQKLLSEEPAAEKIQGLTDQRVLERYGDISSPDELARATDEALHNDARARFIATEYKALAKATGPVRALQAQAKQFAASVIEQKKLRDIKPAQYNAKETRAAREATKAHAKGDTQTAAAEKRNQLLNHALGREAGNALNEIDKAIGYLRKFDRDGVRKSLDTEYVDQIDKLLERVDLRASVPLSAGAKRASLLAWVESQQAQGLDPVIDDALLDEARRLPYREMPLAEFRGLVDTVRNIEHLGRLKKKLLTAKDEREFAERVEQAGAAIRENAKSTVPVRIESNSWRDRVRKGFNEFFAWHRKFSSLVREMDGVKDNGVLWDLLVRPMNEAGDREATMREQATVALSDIFTKELTADISKKKYIPEINGSLSKEGRLAVALNWGNEANRQRLLDGEGWTPAQAQAVLDTLSKSEWDFVQRVWDYVDSYWPQIAAKEQRVSGVTPEKVQAAPVKTQHGEYRGGYYPIKYDPDRSSRAEADDLAETIKQSMQGLYTRATTRRGHTKARADSVKNRPVRKDLGVLFEHINQVAHDLAWHEYLIDANRLLGSKPIDAAIREHYGPEVLRAMKQSLQDMAAGDIAAQSVTDRALNYVRQGATIAGLGWNLTTSFLQPIGLTQSMVRIGPKWVARGLAQWIGSAAKFDNKVTWINERSDFMRLRGKTMQREINEIRNRVSGRNSVLEASYFYFIQKMQLVADVPTWLGMYEKQMAAGVDEATAITLADQAVLDAQGGGQIKDLANVQKGSPAWKLWTNFYSFFNVTLNLTAESTARTNFRDPASVAKYAVDMLLLYSIPAALATMMKAAIKGEDDEEKLYVQLAADQLTYMLGTLVFVREGAAAIQSALGLKGFDYSGPASVRLFGEAQRLATQVQQGEADEAFFKSLNAVGGTLLHYPSGQVQRTVSGLFALSEGETENPAAVVFGPPAK